MEELHLGPSDDLQNILNCLNRPATIYLKGGVYPIKSVIKQSGVTLVGEGRETTVLTGGDYARKIHADGREYNTFRTYTLCVAAPHVKLENLTVENSTPDPKTMGQCVALSVNAGEFSARNVKLSSTQDTLFLSPFPDDLVTRYRGFIPENELYAEGTLTQVFEDCEICGTVDFIFGCGEGYFKNCRLVSLSDGREYGYVAAPAHSLKQARGFTFINCDFVSGGAAEGSVYLARPWRDFGKCDFIDCRAGAHIASELYDKWNDTNRNETARFAHIGLKSERKLTPVGWGRELTRPEANKIIEYANARIATINV